MFAISDLDIIIETPTGQGVSVVLWALTEAGRRLFECIDVGVRSVPNLLPKLILESDTEISAALAVVESAEMAGQLRASIM